MCKSKVFKYCYTIACISTAFGMTVLWMCRYSLDEDSVKIDLKQFQFLEGQYPMISVCLVDPFIESKIKEYNDTLSGEKYRQFLIGERFSIQTKKISFEHVTLIWQISTSVMKSISEMALTNKESHQISYMRYHELPILDFMDCISSNVMVSSQNLRAGVMKQTFMEQLLVSTQVYFQMEYDLTPKILSSYLYTCKINGYLQEITENIRGRKELRKKNTP